MTPVSQSSELMELDRAIAIVRAINQRAFSAMGIGGQCDTLERISLAEMIDAKERVQLENELQSSGGARLFYVVPDDRLIAAAYALQHCDAKDEPVVMCPGRDHEGAPIHKALFVGTFGAEIEEDAQ